MSTEPFGYTYVREADGGTAINGIPYHIAGERMLQALGYEYEIYADAPEEAALAWLTDCVAHGPVVAFAGCRVSHL